MFAVLWVDLFMRNYSFLFLLLFIGFLKSQGSSPYISPGIQLGWTTKANFFLSTQITFGYVSYYGPPPFGLTIGLRTYRMKRKWEEYLYGDFQIWPFLGGIGVGKMINIRNKNKYTRFKTGMGALVYATYDYCKDCGVLKHNIGAIGTIPLFNFLGGNYRPL